jgi:hypothetical protein
MSNPNPDRRFDDSEENFGNSDEPNLTPKPPDLEFLLRLAQEFGLPIDDDTTVGSWEQTTEKLTLREELFTRLLPLYEEHSQAAASLNLAEISAELAELLTQPSTTICRIKIPRTPAGRALQRQIRTLLGELPAEIPSCYLVAQPTEAADSLQISYTVDFLKARLREKSAKISEN